MQNLPKAPKTPKHRRAGRAAKRYLSAWSVSSTAASPRTSPAPGAKCGRPMQRIGEDVSEKLDIIPARFFVHHHIYGKWASRCCQQIRQEPA